MLWPLKVRLTCAAPDDWYLMSIWKSVFEVVNLPAISKPVALLSVSLAPLMSCDVDAWPIPKGRLQAAAARLTNATMTTLRMSVAPRIRRWPGAIAGPSYWLFRLFDRSFRKHPGEVLLVFG